MTKDELIARLQVLGEQLNRDVSLTGTKEELALRVAELEEELDDTDDAAGQDTSVSPVSYTHLSTVSGGRLQ